MRIESLPAGLALMLVLAAALAGCAGVAPAPAAAAVVAPPAPGPATPATNIVTEPAAATRPAPAPVEAMLTYGDRIRGLPPAELAQEIQRLGDSPNTTTRALQLAMALTQQRNPANAARVQALLQRVLAQQDAESQALHPLARLLAEQRDQAERQGQQLREAQRRIEQLNERLEAVRAIERSLPAQPATREQGAAPARRAASAAVRPAP